uniref:Coiled-coil domain containing 69 n=1 Tax=Tetraodon nigroviridis TaxID=99883 RepID=H3C1F7_TETNG
NELRRWSAGPPDVYLEKQLEQLEWQRRTLREVLSASGNAERAELLKQHADEEASTLLLSLLDKVKTETVADLNVAHERRSKAAAEGYEQREAELKRRHQEEKTQLGEEFRAAEDALKAELQQLWAELQDYNQLKRRVQDSSFNRDLQRNIQARGSPGAFWESEQESLVFVIEMKSEQVQEQSRRLQNMEALTQVQKNQALEDQMVQLLQQNEDLQVRSDNSQTLVQQLWKEQQELKEALERQTAVSQNLSQEKEQLIFK